MPDRVAASNVELRWTVSATYRGKTEPMAKESGPTPEIALDRLRSRLRFEMKQTSDEMARLEAAMDEATP